MVFRKTYMKRRKTYMKGRKTYMKRRFTNRKSKKYGGKFIDKTIMNKLVTFLKKYQIDHRDAVDIVDGMEKSPYTYDGADVLRKLKIAVSNDYTDTSGAIFNTLNKIEKEASQKPPSSASSSLPRTSIPPSTTQREGAIKDCPCQYEVPHDCTEKKDYIDQARIFHPDRNKGCFDLANGKFQELASKPGCIQYTNQ